MQLLVYLLKLAVRNCNYFNDKFIVVFCFKKALLFCYLLKTEKFYFISTISFCCSG